MDSAAVSFAAVFPPGLSGLETFCSQPKTLFQLELTFTEMGDAVQRLDRCHFQTVDDLTRGLGRRGMNQRKRNGGYQARRPSCMDFHRFSAETSYDSKTVTRPIGSQLVVNFLDQSTNRLKLNPTPILCFPTDAALLRNTAGQRTLSFFVSLTRIRSSRQAESLSGTGWSSSVRPLLAQS